MHFPVKVGILERCYLLLVGLESILPKHCFMLDGVSG
jgi:hypothetical protein